MEATLALFVSEGGSTVVAIALGSASSRVCLELFVFTALSTIIKGLLCGACNVDIAASAAQL